MVNSKEYMKAYYQSYKGIRKNRIANWKRKGIIVDDYKHYYDTVYFPATHCQTCHVEFSKESLTSTSKNLDHDHSIEDRLNIIGVVCHTCNMLPNRKEMYITNTLGHANITLTKWNTYQVRIGIRKNRTQQTFKTLNEALIFRDNIKNNII